MIMKNINNTASVLSAFALGLVVLTACEGSEIYTVNAPDWTAAKIDSIRAEKEANASKEPAEKTVYPTPTMLGASDCTSAWWSEHTDNIRVAPEQTVYSSFVNYTSSANNWNNYCIVLCNMTGDTEYAVVRSDNYGWGSGYEGNADLQTSCTQTDWAAWLTAMNGAKIDVAIRNNGDGSADVEAIAHGSDGVDYTQIYKGIKVDAENLYFNYTVDNCYLVFDALFQSDVEVLGAEDNSTSFWGAHTANVKIEKGQTIVSNFTNYSSCANNWNNFCVVLCTEDGGFEYCVVRADNYGWGSGYEGNEDLIILTENGRTWDGWKDTMDGVKVTCAITNKGDGTADINIKMVTASEITYTQDYLGIKVNADELYFNFTVDGCHLVFE